MKPCFKGSRVKSQEPSIDDNNDSDKCNENLIYHSLLIIMLECSRACFNVVNNT